jgi:Trypsin
VLCLVVDHREVAVGPTYSHGSLRLDGKGICLLVALSALAFGIWSAPGHAAYAATKLVREDTSPVSARSHSPRLERRRRPRSRRDRAHSAIVGGNPISITQAPWQVEIKTRVPSKPGVALRCGGSILDSAHVLTAAHCVFEPETNITIPPSEVSVLAGTSNFISPEPTAQASGVKGIRVHPYYSNTTGPTSPDPDDVALLELETPLTLNSTAGSIGLVGAGSTPPEGTPVNLTGFGRQAPNEAPNGQLYSLGMTVGFSRQCGGEADALLVCASAPTGSACSGDSGSGLTSTGSPFALVGVADTVEVVAREPCVKGALGGFANLAAPEIRDFIEGNPNPPQAPRGGGASCRVSEPPIVGGFAACQPGNWSNNPAFTYMFIDSKTGQVLQSGASLNYQFSPADVGRFISFQVLASNAGGTGVGRVPFEIAIGPGTQATAPNSPAPTPSSRLSLAGGSIAVKGTGALVKLHCEGAATCTGKLVLTAKVASKSKRKRRSHRTRKVTIGTASFSIAAGATATVQLELNGVGRALLRTGHGRLGARLAIELESGRTQFENVRLVQKARRAHGHKRK